MNHNLTAFLSFLSSPVKKVSAESGDSSVAPITKRIAELEAAEGTPSRGKRVSAQRGEMTNDPL